MILIHPVVKRLRGWTFESVILDSNPGSSTRRLKHFGEGNVTPLGFSFLELTIVIIICNMMYCNISNNFKLKFYIKPKSMCVCVHRCIHMSTYLYKICMHKYKTKAFTKLSYCLNSDAVCLRVKHAAIKDALPLQ